MEIDCGRPVAAQLNSTFDVQLCVFELGMSVHLQFRALRSSLERIIARSFMVEGEVTHMDVCINHGLLQRTRRLSREIHAALHAHTTSLKLRDSSQVKIVSVQIETKSTGGEVVSTGADDMRIARGEMKIFQGDFVAVELKL